MENPGQLTVEPQGPRLSPYDKLQVEFVSNIRAQLSTLTGEIAMRNKRIQENDSYIYGDLLERRLDVPVGHDFTPVNWLRRAVEIHRNQFIGVGFALDSTYVAEDINSAPADPQTGKPDDNAVQRLTIENEKKKSYAEIRRNIMKAIIDDNGGNNFWATAAENASAVGDTIVKAWYDKDKAKYVLQQVEAVEHFYAIWNRDDYRQHDAVAFVNQISKEEAARLYNVPSTVATSPLGYPLAVLSSTQIQEYISTQPMVTVMEVTGKIEGWKSQNGIIAPCKVGQETEMNVVLVGNQVYQLIDDPKDIPHYYHFPNKRQRRRPWGMPDISTGAIQLNLTYIETMSDWRTLASKVNFPKFKGYGFAPGVQMPKPKPRTVEVLPLGTGQDLQPLTMPNSAGLGEQDFIRQIQEIQNQFIREVGISRQLFDMPDENSNSGEAMQQARQSISDLTAAKRALWEPIMTKMFQDAFDVLSLHDDSIKEACSDDDWKIKVSWPSAMNRDDPAYLAMQLNRFNAGTLSVQSFLELMGDDKQEIDRIREEMQDQITAAIHGRSLPELAHFRIYESLGIPLWGFNQPKISLKGDLTPQQEGNLGAIQGWNTPDQPYGASIGPQGLAGERANENAINQGFIQGGTHPYAKYGMPAGITPGQDMNPHQNAPGAQQQPSLPQANGNGPAVPPGNPQMINTGANNHGAGIMSQPGSGATATTPVGKANQHKQRHGG